MILNDPKCIYKQRQGWWNSEDSNLNFWNFVVVTMWLMSMHHVSHWWCHVMWWHLKSWCILFSVSVKVNMSLKRPAPTCIYICPSFHGWMKMFQISCVCGTFCAWKPRECMCIYIYTLIFTNLHGMDIHNTSYVYSYTNTYMYVYVSMCIR